ERIRTGPDRRRTAGGREPRQRRRRDRRHRRRAGAERPRGRRSGAGRSWHQHHRSQQPWRRRRRRDRGIGRWRRRDGGSARAHAPGARQYKIQEVIKRRQVMLVQVVKEERGTKGAALTTYLSLAGRYSVLMPNTARGGGISRKITSADDRRRLKE